MQNTPSVQFADNILSSDYTKNLADFKKIVKSKFAGTVFENSGLPKLSNRTTESLSTRSIITNVLERMTQNEYDETAWKYLQLDK